MKLGALLRLRCPICGKGKLFRGYLDSPERCASCGYFFMRESGYFLPHVVIGYAFTVLVSLGSWPLLRYVFGIKNAAITLAIMIALAVGRGVGSRGKPEGRRHRRVFDGGYALGVRQ